MLNVETGSILLPRPFARNARSLVCGEQYGLTKILIFPRDNRPGKREEKQRPRRSRFSIGSALLTSFTEIERSQELKSEVAKPDRT